VPLFQSTSRTKFLIKITAYYIGTLVQVAQEDKVRLLEPCSSGCLCWFDLKGTLIDPKTKKPYSCGCCPDGYRTCGAPLHQFCSKINPDGWQRGCHGDGLTLSEVGFPCYFHSSWRDCAWCAHGMLTIIIVSHIRPA
jgi:hypothetical protein